MDIISVALILFGATILLGFIGKFIFEKTHIPEIIWLMILGVLIGYTGHISADMLLSVAPVFGAVALAVILFEGGLNMDFYKVVRQFSRATSLAVLNLIFSIIFIAITTVIIFGLFGESLDVHEWGWLHGILLGTIVGGSSSAIIIPVVRGLKIREKIVTFLSLESAITDVLCIVSAIAIIELIIATSGGGQGIAIEGFTHDILSAFSIGAVIGIACGIGWLYASRVTTKIPSAHRLDIAIILVLYGLVESVGGSGAISVLCFGLVLGNGHAIAEIMKTKEKMEISAETIAFHGEVSFFVRTFFFVFLGMMVTISNVEILIIGIILGILLLLARIIPTNLSSMKTDLTKEEKNFILTMAPRGLAAAVLAQLPIFYGIANAKIFSDLVFVIIIVTILIMIIGVKTSLKPDNKENIQNEQNKQDLITKI